MNNSRKSSDVWSRHTIVEGTAKAIKCFRRLEQLQTVCKLSFDSTAGDHFRARLSQLQQKGQMKMSKMCVLRQVCSENVIPERRKNAIRMKLNRNNIIL